MSLPLAVHPASLALAGGRGPAGWGRELSQGSARLRALERAGAWVEPLIAAYPRLRDGPLLGCCLEAVMERAAHPPELGPIPIQPQPARSIGPRGTMEAEREPGRRARARPQPNLPPGWVKRRRAPQTSVLGVARRSSIGLGSPVSEPFQVRSAGPAEEPARHPLPAPLELEPRANRALLERVVGSKLVDQPPPGSRSPTGLARPTMILAGPYGESKKGEVEAPLAAAWDTAAQHGWLEDLARRAGRSLRRHRLDALGGGSRTLSVLGALVPGSTQAAGLDTRPSKRRLIQAGGARGPDAEGATHVALPRDGPALAEAWRFTLDGQVAPLDLLVRLANSPAGDVGAGSGEGLARQHWSLQSGPPRGQAIRSGWRSQPGQVSATNFEGTHVPAGTSTQEDSRHPSEAHPETTSRTPNPGPKTWASARIAPPSGVSALPPLLPFQEVGVPSPPVATAAIQGMVRQEEMAMAGDDLEALAARIKRILDEEARRHGIDV